MVFPGACCSFCYIGVFVRVCLRVAVLCLRAFVLLCVVEFVLVVFVFAFCYCIVVFVYVC